MGNSFRCTPNAGTVDLCLCTEAEKVVGKRSVRRAVSLLGTAVCPSGPAKEAKS